MGRYNPALLTIFPSSCLCSSKCLLFPEFNTSLLRIQPLSSSYSYVWKLISDCSQTMNSLLATFPWKTTLFTPNHWSCRWLGLPLQCPLGCIPLPRFLDSFLEVQAWMCHAAVLQREKEGLSDVRSRASSPGLCCLSLPCSVYSALIAQSTQICLVSWAVQSNRLDGKVRSQPLEGGERHRRAGWGRARRRGVALSWPAGKQAELFKAGPQGPLSSCFSLSWRHRPLRLSGF